MHLALTTCPHVDPVEVHAPSLTIFGRAFNRWNVGPGNRNFQGPLLVLDAVSRLVSTALRLNSNLHAREREA